MSCRVESLLPEHFTVPNSRLRILLGHCHSQTHTHTYRRNKGDDAAGVEEVVDAAGRAKALFGKLVAQMRTRPIRRHCFHPLFMLLAMWSSLFGVVVRFKLCVCFGKKEKIELKESPNRFQLDKTNRNNNRH